MSSVLITGSAGGIGTRTVAAFARRGWTVFASDHTEAIARAAYPDQPSIHPLAAALPDSFPLPAGRGLH